MVPMLEENKQGFCKRYPNRWLGLSHMIFFVVVLQSGRFLSVVCSDFARHEFSLPDWLFPYFQIIKNNFI